MARSPKAAPPKKPKQRIFRRGNNVLTVEIVVKALRATGGVRAHAAEALGVDRSAITNFISRHPEVLPVLDEIEEELNDVAESGLMTAIRSGDVTAIKFRLDRKARNRGYGRNLEVTGPNQGPVQVQHQFDLSKLSAAQLRTLETILAAATIEPDGPAEP